MKNYLKVLIFTIFISTSPFILKKASSEDMMGLGLTGGNCSKLNKLFAEFGDQIEGFLREGVRGFLTGANTSLIIAGKEKEVREINLHSVSYILEYINKECAKDKAKGKDQQVWSILSIYFKDLPVLISAN